MAHGWNTVSNGDDITEVLWNENVRDQMIARYATTAIRDGVTVTDGQMCYVLATKKYYGYNGSSWVEIWDIS